jgi:Na+-driven multidrug efflux pump
LSPLSMGLITAMIAVHGDAAVAAYGAGGKIQMLLLLGPIALGAALMIFVGQNWGARRLERIREALGLSFGFGLAFCLGFASLVALAADPIAAAFCDEPETRRVLAMFLGTGLFAVAGESLGMLGSSILNASGRPLAATGLMAARTFLVVVPAVYLGFGHYGLRGGFIALAASEILAGLMSAAFVLFITRDRPDPAPALVA